MKPVFKNLKSTVIILFLLLSSLGVFSQTESIVQPRNRTGDLYFYWGWNWSWYTDSDIRMQGDNYDFTLTDVYAKDRQSTWDPNTYLNPANATIPQYNFRLGYFIKDHYEVSFGIDHMKYVVQTDQTVPISGYISETGTEYDGSYENDDIVLSTDFLQYEHTDGLNYVNFEFRRFDEIYAFKKISFNLTEGLGAGFLYPRTNVTLLNNQRHDDFHLSGYGFDAVVGLNITFFNHFFIQSEFKGGYINMPDIRTTYNSADKASQHFFYTQFNAVFGATFFLKNKVPKTSKE